MRELVVWATYGVVAVLAWLAARYVYRMEMQARADRDTARLAGECTKHVISVLPRRGVDGQFLPKSHA